MEVWIGLDVGERETQFCAIGPDKAIHFEVNIQTSADGVLSAIDNLPRVTIKSIVMEAGLARGMARSLRALGFPVIMVDARKAHRFLSIRHHKSDRNDARGLAELGMMELDSVRSVHLKSPETQYLRTQLVLRNQMLKQKNALQAVMRSLIVDHGLLPKMPPPTQLRSALERQSLSDVSSNAYQSELLSVLAVWEAMRDYLRMTDIRLKRIAADHPVMSGFMEVPGIGYICAISFFTAIEDPMRFQRSADIGAYLGMVPKVKQSGTMVIKSRITKAGNKLTRTHLVMAARAVISHSAVESAITVWGRELAARIGHSKARVAVARKLAVILLSMWKSGRAYQPYPQYFDLPSGSDRLGHRPHFESIGSGSEHGAKSVAI
ncbi:IS110 family transposase [Sphingopyxis sp.]|uniref:IS110 family transposase n=1 Tax=Sphingopyxis sp. TaxID=1908224 RepID=UPI00262B55B1|nr:IS110 family transposase [Sphingopyxis sp.]MCW0197575.1 IS110 family transposase [Sphingopyxis sp.]